MAAEAAAGDEPGLAEHGEVLTRGRGGDLDRFGDATGCARDDDAHQDLRPAGAEQGTDRRWGRWRIPQPPRPGGRIVDGGRPVVGGDALHAVGDEYRRNEQQASVAVHLDVHRVTHLDAVIPQLHVLVQLAEQLAQTTPG